MCIEDWRRCIVTQFPACCRLPYFSSPSFFRFPSFWVAYAWRVVADVARNDADGTHNHTEWN